MPSTRVISALPWDSPAVRYDSVAIANRIVAEKESAFTARAAIAIVLHSDASTGSAIRLAEDVNQLWLGGEGEGFAELRLIDAGQDRLQLIEGVLRIADQSRETQQRDGGRRGRKREHELRVAA